VHTASIIAQHSETERHVDVGFNDRDYGCWTGQPKAEVIVQWGTVEAAPGVKPMSTVVGRVVRPSTHGLSGPRQAAGL
jgi:broad specificity phosphatase PhoE